MPPKKRKAVEEQKTHSIQKYFGTSNKQDDDEGFPPTKKKPRSSKIEMATPTTDEPVLSSEQKKSIDDKKYQAEAKLWAKKLGVKSLGYSWMIVLGNEFKKEYFTKLIKFVQSERETNTIYPLADDVFSWTNWCPISDVKVVILGQDPYHGPNQAHGLCFSVRAGVPPPPSLVNMYKELSTNIDGFVKPDHGYLAGWAEQGVLLLNACLTVREKQPNSHSGKGWEQLTDAVIHWLNINCKGLVFLLWGAYAQKKGSFIDKKKHHVLMASHPSPFSASKGFFGCKHFSLTNEFLVKQGHTPIDWSHLPKIL